MDAEELKEIFNLPFAARIKDVLNNLTPQEAIERLKTWEEKQKIKVGDVIVSPNGSEAIVHLIDSSGNLGCIDGKEQFFISNSNKKLWKKTNKHIDLTKIFKELGGEDEDR